MAYTPDDDQFYSSLNSGAKAYQNYAGKIAEDQADTTRAVGAMYGQALPNTLNSGLSAAQWRQNRQRQQQIMDLQDTQEGRVNQRFAEEQTDWQDKNKQLQAQRAFEAAPAEESYVKNAGIDYAPGMTHMDVQRQAAGKALSLKDRELISKEKETEARIAEEKHGHDIQEQNGKEARALRLQNHQDTADDRAIHAKELKDAATEKTVRELTFKMSNDLDSSKGRNGPLGAAAAKVANAEAVDAMVAGQGENLDSRQMEELAIGLNRLLSGSSTSASSQVKALVPSTAIGDATKLKEWLLNEPQGVNQQAFVKRMQETVHREADVAREQIKGYQAGKLGGHQWLKENAPEHYNEILQRQGFDLANDFDEKGFYKPKKKTQGKEKTGPAAPPVPELPRSADVDHMTDEEVAAQLKALQGGD